MATDDVLVLRRGTHGMPIDDYAEALRERLPSASIRIARTPEAERSMIESVSVVTGLQIDEPLLSAANELELFACMYSGTGHLPFDRLEAAGVAVTNAAGVHGPNIAEHVIGAILHFVRRFDEGNRRQRRREWRHYRAHELEGSTVTVVGLGEIGRATLSRLEEFGVERIGVRYTPEKGGPADTVVGFDESAFHDVLARTEYLVLACPLTDETRGLIDRAAFETLPPDAVLVNVSRGPVVDTEALVAALRSNQMRGASLDVTDPEPLPEDHPLWTLSNVQLTPHNAGHTPAYYDRLADIVAANVEELRDSGSAENLTNRVVPTDET